jgi:hypothetical protein
VVAVLPGPFATVELVAPVVVEGALGEVVAGRRRVVLVAGRVVVGVGRVVVGIDAGAWPTGTVVRTKPGGTGSGRTNR